MAIIIGAMILLLSSLAESQSLVPHHRSLWWKFAAVVRWIVADWVWWLFALCFLLAFPVFDATLQLL